MSSLKQLKVVKSSISGRVEVVLSCSAMLMVVDDVEGDAMKWRSLQVDGVVP